MALQCDAEPRVKPVVKLSRPVVSAVTLALPLILVLACIWWKPAAYAFERIYDDSYYYIQIARHIAAGHGSTFDGVTRTNGYQPLWMWICVPVCWFVHDWLSVPLALIVVQSLIATAGLFILERSWRRSLGTPLSVCAAIVFSVNILWIYFNLMESGVQLLFLACVSWIVLRDDALEWLAGKGGIVAGMIFLGFCFTRLDNAIIVVGILAGLVIAWLQTIGWRRALAGSLRIGLPIILGFAPYLLYNYLAFGDIVPINGRVKHTLAFNPKINPSTLSRFWTVFKSTFAHESRGSLTYLSIWIGPLMLAYLCYAAQSRRDARNWLKAGVILGMLAHFVYFACNVVNGLYIWYILPYSLVSVYLVFRIAMVSFRRISPNHIVAAAAILATSIFFCSRARNEFQRASGAPDIREVPVVSQLRELAAKYPSATAAGWNAGQAGYAFDGRLTNLDGLVNDFDYLHRYLSQYRTIDYILEKRFDFVVDNDKSFGFNRPREQVLAGMNAEAYRRLFETYNVVHAGEWVILIRKDAAELYFPGQSRSVTLADLKW